MLAEKVGFDEMREPVARRYLISDSGSKVIRDNPHTLLFPAGMLSLTVFAFIMLGDAVREALDKAGLKPELAEVTMKPLAETVLAGDDAHKMQKLLDALDDLDDVQQVYTTAAIEE